MTYYGYKRGDNTKIVDWASVSSKLTTDLGDIEKGRADERQKIEGEIAAANESINEMPVGNHESINNFVLGAANLAAERLRVQSTLMKNGQLKPSQFASFRQNVMDGVGGYKKVATTYNKIMDELVARQETREGGLLEAKEAELMQKLANLSNTVVVIDERTGTVMNALKLPNGEPDMNSAMPVRDMENLSLKKHDRFDIDKNLDPIVAKYGKEVQVINKLGVKTKESIAARQDFDKAVDLTIGSYNPFQLASVLFDYEQTHTPTENEAERDADPDKFVLVKKDGNQSNKLTPVLTKSQEDQAKAAIKQQLLMKLNYVETPMATTDSGQTEADKKRQSAADAALEETTRLWNLFTGDEAKKAEVMDVYRPSIEALLGKGNYGGYDITDNQIILYQRTKDGLEPRVIDIPSDFKSFVDLASTNFGLSKNLDEMYDKSTAGIEGFNQAAKYVTANVQKRPSIMYKPTKTIDDAASDLDDALGEITSGFGYYGKDEITAGKIGLDAARAAKSYLTSVGLTGAIVEKGEGNSVKITLDGITPRGGITVKLTETKSGARADLGTALKVIHDAAGMGQLVTGYPTAEETTEPPKPDPANPAGKDVITVEDLPD